MYGVLFCVQKKREKKYMKIKMKIKTHENISVVIYNVSQQ
jgi:hypothetical protein